MNMTGYLGIFFTQREDPHLDHPQEGLEFDHLEIQTFFQHLHDMHHAKRF